MNPDEHFESVDGIPVEELEEEVKKLQMSPELFAVDIHGQPLITAPEPPSPDKDRLTVLLNIIHELQEECRPTEFVSRVSVGLEETEQPVIRRMKVGTEWTALNLRMDKPGMLVVLNRTRWRGTVRPTEEEARDIARRVIVVGGLDCSFEARPGLWFAGWYHEGTPQVRSLHGVAEITLYVFPG